jgi:hypothetical protein
MDGTQTYIAHETAVCRNPHHSSNRDFRITRVDYIRKNVTRLSVGPLMMCQVFSVSYKIVYRWVATNCCFMNYIIHPETNLKTRAQPW